MGSELFKREVAVTIGTTRITNLRMAFKIHKTTKPEPNVSELSIWNLNKDNRARFQAKDDDVLIEAGYASNIAMIFKGKLRKVTSTAQGPDWVTTLKTGDGEKEFQSARINEKFAPGTPIATAIKRVAQSLGVGLGDSAAKIDGGLFREGLTQFINGAVASGFSRDLLTRLLRAQGIEWSIQNEQLQLLSTDKTNPNFTTSAPAVLLTPASGLIGSPEAGENGKVKVTSLLQPSLIPGAKFNLQTQLLNGLYRVDKVTHTGDTHAKPWYSEIEGRIIS